MDRRSREQELTESGLFESIKYIYGMSPNIPDKYYMLMADYIDCILQAQEALQLDPEEVARSLPNVLARVKEEAIGVYGVTENNEIIMNNQLSYEQNKLYFFHELTHAIQSRGEKCSLSNGKNGNFLMEGLTQYTAEILFHVSNGDNISYRNQYNCVRGHSNHVCHSPLSEYQLNGSILHMLGQATNTGIGEMMALGYKQNGREILKEKYESIPGNEGCFEKLMDDLEAIHIIDKAIIMGYGSKLQGDPMRITMNGITINGNLETQEKLINNVERQLAASYIMNHDDAYILENYSKFHKILTTEHLQQQFLKVVDQIEQDVIQQLNSRGNARG